jgi:hypothetical protein
MTKARKTLAAKRPGRPSGPPQRRRIDLPDGDQLWAFYTDWANDTGISTKYLQRNRKRFKDALTVIAGVVYVRNNAGRRVLAEPTTQRRARR